MDNANSEILAKVKKLLALGTSPSEAEAASALEKARTLLARYGLSMTDVEAHSPDVVEGVLLEKKRLRSWESHLIYIIALSTFTQSLHVSRGGISQVLLIGREINTAAAAELFAYLHLVVLKLGREHSSQVAHLESFKRGVVERIGERLREAAEGTEKSGGPWAANTEDGRSAKTEGRKDSAAAAAVTSDRQLTVRMALTAERENQDFIAGKYGKTKTKRVGRRVEASSYHKGRAAGEGVSLNRQIKSR